MTKEFYATLAEGGKAETGQTQDLQVLALTNPELEPALDEAMGAPVLWLTQNIFYASVEPVCVVFKTMYQQMAEADQSELTLRLQDPLSPEAGAVEVKLTEAGLHGGDTSTVYLPWGYAQRLMEENASNPSAAIPCNFMSRTTDSFRPSMTGFSAGSSRWTFRVETPSIPMH